ncbi:SAV_2336 N-terminal domain-related protein [Streptomyces sp. NPDC026665]|uniref:SAV_2336 N-terminal domain-related protein n=1 Tax=Streptomyces sp. NPDC026665 TaxID=3154798 RepID=UPI0033F82C21
MSSEDPGPALLAELLGRAGGGQPPTSVELAELLWLAGHVRGPAEEESRAPGSGGTPASPRTPPAAPRRTDGPPDPAAGPAPDGADPPDDGRVPLRLPGSDTGGNPGSPERNTGGAGRDAPHTGAPDAPHTTLLAPAPPMLPHPLALQRTLRPLKRRVPAPAGHTLDEEATADRIARLGAAPAWWLPVLRPATERWLTLHLVHDTGPTMPVWRPLVRELHTALAQSGVFRTVELHRLTAAGTVRRPGSQESCADGRTVTLLVSDCMGAQWRGGPAGALWYRTLRRWAARMPVAVLQPLPERLWRTTALPATTARLTAPWPAAPNSAYTVDSYASDDRPGGAALALPVLEPSARWLANWSSLVAGGGRLPGSVALLDTAPAPDPLDAYGRGDVDRLSAEELVLRFRSLASPEAFRLAGHLAVGRPELPVMRLVHAAIERSPRPQHLAEVILSGLLGGGPSGRPGSYSFRPGVRELLLRTLPRTAYSRTTELLGHVGALIDARAGVTAGEFPVVAPGPGDARADGEAFASVREESVRRLGGGAPPRAGGLMLGRYRPVRRLGRAGQLTQAEDTRDGRTVVVQTYPPTDREPFLEDAAALAGVEHPNVVGVLDFGFEGDVPCLVTEFVEGLTVAELTAEGGFALPFSLLAPLAQQLARGLSALHEQGVTHGRLTPDALLIRPDGTLKITRFAPGTARDRDSSKDTHRDPSKDMHRFGRLLRELTSGAAAGELSSVPSEFRALLSDVLNPLVSGDPRDQRRGMELLFTPSFTRALEAAEHSRLRYRMLDRVRVTRGDHQVRTLPPQQQALLCMLLERRGRPVPYAELVEGMWDDRPQQRATRLLATHATGLRQALGPGTLATTTDGYALHVEPDCVDLALCEDFLAASKDCREAGDPGAAGRWVRRALDLFLGDPLDGVPGPAANATRGRLRALRLALCATRAELDLETGDFGRAANDLDELLRSHPRHLEFRRLHILALKGQGRVTAAIESYRAYDALRGPAEPDPRLLGLYEELRADPDRGSPVIAVEYTADFPEDPHTHSVLGRTLTWLLSLSDLAPNEYELLGRDNGYVVITVPDASVLTALNVVLRELPGALLELDDPPRLRVTFWHTALFARTGSPTVPRDWPGPDRLDADVVVVLSRPLYEELTRGGAAVSPDVFRPLYRQPAGDGPAVAWYCTLDLPERLPELEPVRRDLVRGPFTTRDLTRLRGSEQGRTAVVHLDADTRPTLLDPGRPRGKRPPRSLVTYYEVDLTTHGSAHELALPSSGRGSFAASVELSWHVDDPVAFVGAEIHDVSGRLLDHLVKEAGRITRRHPLRRAGAAQRAVHEGLRRWPVPGLSVACAVRLRDGAPDGDAVERDGP